MKELELRQHLLCEYVEKNTLCGLSICGSKDFAYYNDTITCGTGNKHRRPAEQAEN